MTALTIIGAMFLGMIALGVGVGGFLLWLDKKAAAKYWPKQRDYRPNVRNNGQQKAKPVLWRVKP